MKQQIKSLPIIGSIAHFLYRNIRAPLTPFNGSESYWKERYLCGGNSGAGSYGELASFKAEILNEFVEKNNIQTIIEYGCGDGNQLKLAKYPRYIGFDVVPEAITVCKKIFAEDVTKSFYLTDQDTSERADLTLSLDVIYHLTEDAIFDKYMVRLFNSSNKFVCIYSSNTNTNSNKQPPHVKHRNFSKWIERSKPEWNLLNHIPNRFPMTGNPNGSFADFYFYKLNKL